MDIAPNAAAVFAVPMALLALFAAFAAPSFPALNAFDKPDAMRSLALLGTAMPYDSARAAKYLPDNEWTGCNSFRMNLPRFDSISSNWRIASALADWKLFWERSSLISGFSRSFWVFAVFFWSCFLLLQHPSGGYTTQRQF